MKVTKEYCDLCGEQIDDRLHNSQFMIHKVIQTRLWYYRLETARAEEFVICKNCTRKLAKWIEDNKKK